MACFQVAISAPSHYKYKLIIKFYNGVFGLSQNRHLKQTAVVKSVLLRFNLSTFVKCQVFVNNFFMINSYIPIMAIIEPKNQEAISSNDLLAGLVPSDSDLRISERSAAYF